MPGHSWYDPGPPEWINTGTYTSTSYYDWRWPTNEPYTLTFNTATSSTSTMNIWVDRSPWRGSLVATFDVERHERRPMGDQVAPADCPDPQLGMHSAQVQREASRQARVAAIARGEELLLSLLDEAQAASYRLDGNFEVIGSHGTLYRVHRGTSGNIEWVKPDGSTGGRLCAHPTMARDWLPTEDVMLAQLLALMTDEREFVRIANVHAGQRPPIHRRMR